MKFLKNLVVWFRKDPAPALCQYCKRLTKPGELVNGHPTHHGCLMAAAAVVDQALGAEVFDERAVPRVQGAFDALVLAGFSREAISALTEMEPADSPAIVTCRGSPPNAAMFRCTHCSAATWSSIP